MTSITETTDQFVRYYERAADLLDNTGNEDLVSFLRSQAHTVQNVAAALDMLLVRQEHQ